MLLLCSDDRTLHLRMYGRIIGNSVNSVQLSILLLEEEKLEIKQCATLAGAETIVFQIMSFNKRKTWMKKARED